MTATNFQRALVAVLVHEGGYSNHPRDPGGETNKGITHRVYDAWRISQKLPIRSVREISKAEIAAIYKRQYWDNIHGDDLPAGLDYAVFDYAVNSGPARAVGDLQKCMGLNADGALGLNTLKAIKERDTDELVDALCTRRLKFLKSLRTWGTFGKGWGDRVADVRRKGMLWAIDNHPPPDMEPVDVSPDAGAKADPADVAMTKTPEGVGGAMTGAGTVGTMATETAEKLSIFTEYSGVIKVAFIILLLVGVGVTAWALYKKRRVA